MKQAASICMAAARQIVWKLLLIAAVMAAAECILFFRVLPDGPVTNGRDFGRALENAQTAYVFGIALLLLTAVLCWQGMDMTGGKVGYTLRRLSVSESVVTTLWAAVHVGAYVILWAVQVLLVLVFWSRYIPLQTGHLAPRLELLVECYRDGFLHSLLPLADAGRWLRIGLWFLCLGVAAAHQGFVQRRGKLFTMVLPILTLGWMTYKLPMGNTAMDGILILVFLLFLGIHLNKIWRCRDEEA